MVPVRVKGIAEAPITVEVPAGSTYAVLFDELRRRSGLQRFTLLGKGGTQPLEKDVVVEAGALRFVGDPTSRVAGMSTGTSAPPGSAPPPPPPASSSSVSNPRAPLPLGPQTAPSSLPPCPPAIQQPGEGASLKVLGLFSKAIMVPLPTDTSLTYGQLKGVLAKIPGHCFVDVRGIDLLGKGGVKPGDGDFVVDNDVVRVVKNAFYVDASARAADVTELEQRLAKAESEWSRISALRATLDAAAFSIISSEVRAEASALLSWMDILDVTNAAELRARARRLL